MPPKPITERWKDRMDKDNSLTDAEKYGIENPEAPGEPNRQSMAPVSPVPGTGHEAREEHQRLHDERGETPPERNFNDLQARREREEREEAQSKIETGSDDV